MADFRQAGVCGINPISPTIGNANSLFPRKQNYLSGPTCPVLKPKLINISVFNNYDPSEGIDCYLDIYSNKKLVACRRINKSESLNYKLEIPDSEQAENYKIVIYSPAKHGKVETKENLGVESGLLKSIVAFSNTSTWVEFGISRRESILHDFMMKFNVARNLSVKGTAPIYELRSMSDVAQNSALITLEAKKQDVDVDLVKAIMYMETTHGYYDAIPALFDKNKSILPMNIRSDYWQDIGFSREELKELKNNIAAGVYLLKKLSERVSPYSVEGVATLYQDLGATQVTEYGARVKAIYDKKLWIPEPSFLEKINMEINRFERLSPMEQINLLNRLFGRR